ncbi:hypothetical protein SADO_09402 [Salinisphaera dokdonensis CL-ES53]|uniref:BON domain-containing protein n=1 Tax=Salinisphaera dokdonensis CL-ES53 TaxID=1304272 RepID=A0ABV2B0S0_9GAMM
MTTQSVRPAALLVAITLGLATLAGCSETPQEKYDNAVEKLNETRESRNDAQEKVASKKEELSELQANLNEAEAKLQEARKKVEAASQAVNKTVNDEVLFRTIQREVLDKKEFDKAAISVGVKNRVVTLTGNVPDDETRKRAIKLARSQAGVQDVIDELEVADGETSAPPPASNATSNAEKPSDKPQQKAPEQKKPQPPKKAAGDKPASAENKPQSENDGDKPSASDSGDDSSSSEKPAKPEPQMGES